MRFLKIKIILQKDALSTLFLFSEDRQLTQQRLMHKLCQSGYFSFYIIIVCNKKTTHFIIIASHQKASGDEYVLNIAFEHMNSRFICLRMNRSCAVDLSRVGSHGFYSHPACFILPLLPAWSSHLLSKFPFSRLPAADKYR